MADCARFARNRGDHARIRLDDLNPRVLAPRENDFAEHAVGRRARGHHVGLDGNIFPADFAPVVDLSSEDPREGLAVDGAQRIAGVHHDGDGVATDERRDDALMQHVGVDFAGDAADIARAFQRAALTALALRSRRDLDNRPAVDWRCVSDEFSDCR